MECFYHTGKSAVGVCKSCQRGLCRGCAKEVTNGIACVSRCETEAEKFNLVVQRGPSLNEKGLSLPSSANTYIQSIILGGVFIFFGVYQGIQIMAALGIVFLAFGAFDFLRTWKAKRHVR